MTNALQTSLRRLDERLRGAIDKAAALRPAAAGDAFRGLYIDAAEIEVLLARPPGESELWSEFVEGEETESNIARLCQLFSLSAFDREALLIALAPEIDLRYERLYAFLQDDVNRRRPSVDLILNLTCARAAEKIARRVHFAPESPLISAGILRLLTDPAHLEPPLLAHFVKVDEQIVKFLLGEDTLDPRLSGFCRYVEPSSRSLSPNLQALVAGTLASGENLRLYFQGPDAAEIRATAESVAAAASARLLIATLSSANEAPMSVVQREAFVHGAVLLVEGVDTLPGEWRGITILGGAQSSNWPGATTIRLPDLGYAASRNLWQTALSRANVECGEQDISAVAASFVLTASQIDDAARSAPQHATLRAGVGVAVAAADLFAAAKAQCGQALAALARKIEPRNSWTDIVLPPDVKEQLREVCDRALASRRILTEWGFERKFTSGKGVSALFMGPSGTGKTLAAEVVAGELDLDLYRIDLSGIVSKYIGETEKNLDRVFNAARNANAILFFDEADALFGKRSEVRDAHDRYANIEIAYLLQKMEEYEGVAILGTNLRQNFDDSFLRRLTFCVHFPFPDESNRLRIWQQVWPDQAPLAEDADFPYLARRFKLTGGNIRNIALSAAFLAASEALPVGMDHLMRAVRREYQKLGKQLNPVELLAEASS